MKHRRAKGETPLKPRRAGDLYGLVRSVVDVLVKGSGMAKAQSQKPKKPKTRVFSFRVPEDEYAEYENKLLSAGLDASKFFREAFRNFNVTFEAPSKDYERLLFLYNKSSNNLNQLAYRVNSTHRKSGIISQSLYIKWLNELVQIRELLQAGVNHVD